ncbi:2-hydroxyacyl-CoA dehydratase subunit D [Sinanaerobacter chloroacetimidivorans]|uniref:2-hydroxyacyl-CoA dehydratase n=1 Tax=Sinanaerobacter chloroacetimidivorans TaxID=2818044 RepID=A0A8J7W714_9FIRM|nr:2-hydroxyacyl-CoA dehydratase family protein [Sinanaerobacter chloroacetimidivorans]MBR0600095.1 2-hydroxyacyl-CoA dehydratase [Sinanaerobacter chloroacetimidivorans]
MNRINDLINEFISISTNPQAEITSFIESTGRGAVGVMPAYSPEEIIHAAGFLPVGIWGGQKSISKARAYLPPFTCSIMQSVMELQLEGAYDILKAVVFSVPCDTLKCMSQKWKGSSPVLVFTHPQNRKIKAASKFLEAEYRILRDKLEEILGVEISELAIQNSIKIYNDNRRTMRDFTNLVADYPHIIDPATRHAVIKARWFMEKSRHTALVRELMSEIRKQPMKPWKGKRAVLTGITAEPDEILQIFKEYGFAVVADDLAQESRQFRIDVPEGNDPFERIAGWWLEFDGCCLATNPLKPRGAMLIEMVGKYKADAVIVCMMKFCDPEEFDYPIYHAQLEKAGIRNLYLEIDQETASFEQMKTRVQSFREIL